MLYFERDRSEQRGGKNMARRRPRWLTEEQWQGYLEQVAQENDRLLVILRRK